MSSLASQKQLLVAESELNRAQMVQECQTLTAEVRALTRQAKAIGSIASVIAAVVGGVASFRHKNAAPAATKPSWWQNLLKGAGAVSLVWSAFRSQNHGSKE
jgi:negative regulator of sigma E activity